MFVWIPKRARNAYLLRRRSRYLFEPPREFLKADASETDLDGATGPIDATKGYDPTEQLKRVRRYRYMRQSVDPVKPQLSTWCRFFDPEQPGRRTANCNKWDAMSYRAYNAWDSYVSREKELREQASRTPAYYAGQYENHDGAISGTTVVLWLDKDGTYTREESFSSSNFSNLNGGVGLSAGPSIRRPSSRGTWKVNELGEAELSNGESLNSYTKK